MPKPTVQDWSVQLQNAMQQQLFHYDAMLEKRHSALQQNLKMQLKELQEKMTDVLRSRPSFSSAEVRETKALFAPFEASSPAALPPSLPPPYPPRSAPSSNHTVLDSFRNGANDETKKGSIGGNEEHATHREVQSVKLMQSQASVSLEESAARARRNNPRCRLHAFQSALSHKTHSMDDYLDENRHALGRLVRHPNFDAVMLVIVCINVLVMFLELESRGYELAVELGLRSESDIWIDAAKVFDVLHHVFNIVFVLELVLRVLGGGLETFRSKVNLFDAIIISLTCIDAYVFRWLLGSSIADLSFARIARMFKLVKMSRAVRVATLFHELRVLIYTFVLSMRALFWSCVLLGFIIVCCGLFMAQMAEANIADVAADLEMRQWLFFHYGSGTRATYTLFESTLSGCWPNYARRMIHEFSILYLVFWIPYVILVIFAVMRIISALFLKNTLKASEGDVDMMVTEKQRERDKQIKQLRQALAEADVNVNGELDHSEFERAVENPTMQKYFGAAGIDPHTLQGLFHALADGDGVISNNAFIAGVMRLTGHARAIDQVLIMHDQQLIRHGIEVLLERLCGISVQ